MIIIESKSPGIIRLKENDKSQMYVIENGEAEIRYKLKRNVRTKKFPELDIAFSFYGESHRDLFGCICVPKFTITTAGRMCHIANNDVCEFKHQLDVNIYRKAMDKNVDEIEVIVFTVGNMAAVVERNFEMYRQS